MIRKRAFYRRTRRGKVLRVMEEAYLRDDLGCGSIRGTTVDVEALRQLAKGAFRRRLVVLDTNVVLAQMDLLERSSEPFRCIVVLQTVLNEVRHQNLSLYRRLKALMADESRELLFFANEHHRAVCTTRLKEESPNDRNDRAIRVAAAWLQSQLAGGAEGGGVLLLTNDRACRAAARASGTESETIHAHVRSFGSQYVELMDLLAAEATDADESASSGTPSRPEGAPASSMHPPHESMEAVAAGLRQGLLFQGTLRSEGSRWDECYVIVHGKDGERVAVGVRGRDRVNRAVEGDVVAIEMLPKAQWDAPHSRNARATGGKQGGKGSAGVGSICADTGEATVEERENVQVGTVRPAGRVVSVIRRRWRQYAGTLLMEGGKLIADGVTVSALFLPVDKRMPPIRVSTRQASALADSRILVAIDAWPQGAEWPRGHYVNTLGRIGEKGVETQVVLHEHDIPFAPFTKAVLECLPPPGWKITPENSAGRRDLKALPILSIDPPGCKDIDDALHCIELENGNWQVGVHIADVTHFVAANSPLDVEAARRSTSTYLVDRRLDMLPGLLTTQLCSLRAKEDHFAFSVLWEMTPTGSIVTVDFCKSVIHSIAALTYDEAQLMIDDVNNRSTEACAVRRLNKLARIFRARRIDAGALTLASPEVRFTLDSDGNNPTDVHLYETKEANSLVEEFMLLANITVGKKILRHFPTLSVLRRHPAPSKSQFDELLSAASAVGVALDVSSSRRLADSLDAAQRPSDPYFNKLLRILATRCMTPAQYFNSGELPQEDWHHYGLAAPIYTHFTSPIRRYADVLVHRALAAAIGVAPLPQELMDKGRLNDLTDNMNRRHRAAQLAGRSSVALHTQLFFKEKSTEEKAYVLSVKADAVSVLVPRFGIEGVVPIQPPRGVTVDHDATAHTISLRQKDCEAAVLRVFDAVRVLIFVAVEDIEGRRAVNLRIVEPDLSFGAAHAGKAQSGREAVGAEGGEGVAEVKGKRKGSGRGARTGKKRRK